MKKLYILLFTFLISSVSFGQEAIITGYVDSPCTNAAGRTVEIYVNGTINFTGWNLVRQANGGGYTFNISLSSLGTITNAFAYITNNATTLSDEFGITTNVIVNSGITDNGDDAFQITDNSTPTPLVIDRFGQDAVDGTSTAWDHEDTYYYRVNGTPANGGAFVITTFTYGALNLLDGKGLCNSSSALSTLVPFGTYSTTPSTTPTINVSGAVSGMFYYENNPPSSEKTFSVSGINLTADIVVTAPLNFELSLVSGGTYAQSLNISPVTGTVDPTTIYVRLVSGLSANTYIGDVTVSSTDAADQTVALSGLVSPADPLIRTSGSVNSLEYAVGSGPSNEDSFSIDGIFLTDDITISAPTNFEISLTSGNGFGNSVTVIQTSGTAPSTEIYVRLVSGLAQNSYSGDITATSTGAIAKTVPVSGTVNPAAVCANVGDIIITEIMQNPSINADPAGEYIELYNTTSSPIDIKGWVIKDDATASESHVISTSLIIPANGYIVVGNAATPNGGVTMNYTYANDISLGNSGDGIILECSSTLIDQVIWTTSFPFSSGVAMELSTTTLDATSNDSAANWGAATSTFGDGDKGTPGSANDFTLSTKYNQIENFTMYPNPTNLGFVNISSKSNAKMAVSVFDILGKQVLNETISNNVLNVSKLNAGIYVMKVQQDNAITTKKLVIE